MISLCFGNLGKERKIWKTAFFERALIFSQKKSEKDTKFLENNVEHISNILSIRKTNKQTNSNINNKQHQQQQNRLQTQKHI